MPVEFDPIPVHSFQIDLGAWIPLIHSIQNPNEVRTASLCRGTP